MEKKRLLLLTILLLMALMPLKTPGPFSVTTEAASKKAKNQKAHKLYEKKMNSTVARYTSVSLHYKYADITGDNTDELIISYNPGDGGSGSYLEIYSYKSGKAKQILSQIGYAGKVIAYKNKRLICYTCSHANEIYEYYVKKGGKYRKTVSKSRYAVKADAGKDTAWEYYNKAGKRYLNLSLRNPSKDLRVARKP